MKNLIVTTAVMLFILIVMGWQMELRSMVHQKQRFQYAAEEAAAAVAVGTGRMDESEGKRPMTDIAGAVQKAEESLRLQMSGEGGPSPDGQPVSAEVSFEQKGEAGMAVVVIVRQGKLTASGWYPMQH